MCLLIRVRGGERVSGRAGEEAGRGAEAGAGTTAGAPGSPAPRPPPSLWEKRRRGSDCGVDELCTSRNAILIPFPEQVCISPSSLPEAHRSPLHHAWEPSALSGRKYAPGAPARGTRAAARCLGLSGSDLLKNFWGWGGRSLQSALYFLNAAFLGAEDPRAPRRATCARGGGAVRDGPGALSPRRRARPLLLLLRASPRLLLPFLRSFSPSRAAGSANQLPARAAAAAAAPHRQDLMRIHISRPSAGIRPDPRRRARRGIYF